MFSGIIEEVGCITKILSKTNLIELDIDAKKVSKGTKIGDSICVDGVCLTVIARGRTGLTFEVMKETLDCTTLGIRKEGDKVNLERSIKADGRMHGHFVSGHVDCVLKISNLITSENYTEYQFQLNRKISKLIMPKGSVCIDGISLTVGAVDKKKFSVYLIPFTKIETGLGGKKKGDLVNIETDLLAKYIHNK